MRLKALDAYYSNIDMSGHSEYSTCEYYINCVGNALFSIFWLKIVLFAMIFNSEMHMSGLKWFESYQIHSGIFLVLPGPIFLPIAAIWYLNM